MKPASIVSATALILSTSVVWAQGFPVYTSTGTLELSIDGNTTTYHTTSNTVPGQPGRLLQTANWRVFPPKMLGGVNLAPPGVMISMSARPSVEPDLEAPQLSITFSLDETTHALLTDAAMKVDYTVRQGPLAGTYQDTAPSLQIESVTPGSGDTLTLTGQVAGTLTREKSDTNGASDTLDYTASFTVTTHPH